MHTSAIYHSIVFYFTSFGKHKEIKAYEPSIQQQCASEAFASFPNAKKRALEGTRFFCFLERVNRNLCE
jgi:hypothetical protein